jgi:arylsulfatase A-like enzyme
MNHIDKLFSGIHQKIGFVLILSSVFFNACSNETEKPNILWITIEDTSPQFIGFYGNKVVKTPNIDRLAREGVIFNNVFGQPVCGPSRSILITGVNTQQLGTGNMRSQYPIPEYIKGFPFYLRTAGYYTSNNVKTDYNTLNEKAIIAASWNESSSKAGWHKRAADQKFFSVFNFMESHQSYTMTNPWNWYTSNVLTKLSDKDITRPEEIDVPPMYRDSEEMRKHVARVYNCINLLDIRVGLLLDSLKRDGLMESTIIFFFGDNGEAIPRGKSSGTGLSYHVPFFIWFPEKYKHLSPWGTGKSTDELVSFEDLPPTVLSLAGAEIPAYMTGRPILGKQRKQPSPYAYGSRDRIGETPDLSRMATDGRFFYSREFFQRYPSVGYQRYADVSDLLKTIRKDFSDGKLNHAQSIMLERRDVEYLYDLKNDPWEINNLAKDPKFASKLAELRKATYDRLLLNKDVHFLTEYEIHMISEKTLPYNFRNDKNFNSKELIDAAYEATDPATMTDRLIELLNDKNPYIRYWGAVGIHNNSAAVSIDRKTILSAMKDEYPQLILL